MAGVDSLEALLRTAARLRPDLKVEVVAGTVDGCRIGRIDDDSRRIGPGDLFVARPGTVSDGAAHIADAVAAGAAAILGEAPDPPGVEGGQRAVRLRVAEPLEAGVAFARARWGDPADRLRIAGVTGTNGKTTVATFIRQLVAGTIGPCGLVGTIETHDGRAARPARVTTPGRIELVELLAGMVDAGCDRLAMEVSSHALDQGRVADLDFEVAIFTNLSGDHLDYHRTMEAYAEAKARLFDGLGREGVAVVNLDDPAAERMLRNAGGRRIGIFRRGAAASRTGHARVDRSVSYEIVAIEPAGMVVRVAGLGGDGPDGVGIEIPLRLHGAYNAFNVTAALVSAIELGVPVDDAAALASRLEAPRGRLEAAHDVAAGDRVRVFVDYAHTDDAIATVLAAMRDSVPEGGRLVAVIGAGGDRDRGKRPRMMRAALDHADRVAVTSDNPRTEDPEAIVREVASGAGPGETADYFIEVDRRRAIDRVVQEADDGDVVVIMGKGHEAFQLVGVERRPFDDRAVAVEALERRRGAGG
ncbi:MAG: UDP-N-acetylmuramoyl-L-alanyl-D-glutamate--2,6-diaminopimelate ligase [Planctomycetota bacterium]|nr:UDP-N-acetylmuramoyl-L-alanyl-D-glutamate--2,6-diaminopimelate ligase [Planctomycetota bacterium]